MFIYAYYAFVFATIGFVILFQALFVKSNSYIQLVCSIIWLLPIAYEIWAIGRCGSDCSSREDLLLVFPAEVIVLSVASLYSWRASKRYSAQRR